MGKKKSSKKAEKLNIEHERKKRIKRITTFILAQVLVIALTATVSVVATIKIIKPDEPIVTDTIVAEASEIEEPVSIDIKDEEVPKEDSKNESDYKSFDEIVETGLPEIFEEDSELIDGLKKLLEKHPEASILFENYEDYPEELLAWVCVNDEVLEYAMGYADAEDMVYGGVTEEEREQSFPLLMQFDPRWGYYSYGDGNMAFCGCAPTAMSMVCLALTGDDKYTPDYVADYCMEHNLYVNGYGTDWNLFTNYTGGLGVKSKILGLGESAMVDALKAGHPLILSLGPGDFTKNGHIIVVVGYKNGKFIVRDPSSKARSYQPWAFDRIRSQIKGIWEFSPL